MSKQDAESHTLSDTTIVDVDVHISYHAEENTKQLVRYLDEPYSTFLNPDVGAYDSPYPTDGLPRSRGGKIQMEVEKVIDSKDTLRVPLCDEFGVDHPVVNTPVPLDLIRDTNRAVAEMQAANQLLLDHYLDENDDFLGVASLTSKRPDKAAEELDRLGNEDQIVGGYFFVGGEDKPLGDPCYDVIYEAAVDNDLAILFHGSPRMFNMTSADALWQMEDFFSVHVLGHPMSLMVTLTSLIANGVPEKFPDLNFVMLESGIGWVPYMMSRLNRDHAELRDNAPLLRKQPEEYIRESFYFSTQPHGEFIDQSHLTSLIDIVGADSLLFATDYPHFDFDNPESVDTLLQSLSAEDREKVLYKNAAEIFDLDI